MGMTDQEFFDCYYVLQVHHSAEPEIVKSAYRRLVQMNHPDHNPDPKAMAKMQLINRAYEVISSPEKRRAFHSQWLRHQESRQSGGNARSPKADDAAQQALDAYFYALLHENWRAAYDLLTARDKKLVPFVEFCEWKQAVGVLYQMGAYAIKPFRSYARCSVEEVEYARVSVFSVFLSDRDIRTKAVSEETYTKYVVQDRDGWRVCLGYSELKSIIIKLKYLAAQAPEMDPARVYTDTMLRFDRLTGFFSHRGLHECVEKEIARAQRFKNAFCIAVFTVRASGRAAGLSGADTHLMCLASAATQIKGRLRAIDCAARFSESQLAVLLIGTDSAGAKKAADRLIRGIRHKDGLSFSIDSSVTAYQGESAEDTLLRASHDASMHIVVGSDNTKRYRIHLGEAQV
jgi:diguanylate cyclase (GGDEF)-like protein